MEKTNKGAITEQKLKVVYLPAEGGSTNNQGIPEEEEAGEASRVEEPVSDGMFPREDGFDHGPPLHSLFRNFQLQIIIFILASNSFFVIRMAENNTYHDGLARWTKEYDPALFRNAGLTYWEIEHPPCKPFVAVCSSCSFPSLILFAHDHIIP